MGSAIDALGKSFERLLRWLYPGALFLLLLYISNPVSFIRLRTTLHKVSSLPDIWGLVFVAVVVGMGIYLAQTYFFNQLISLGFSHTGLLDTETKEMPENFWKWVARRADTWGESAWRRWGVRLTFDMKVYQESRDTLSNWLNYAWSTYHAGLITIWLTIIFYCLSQKDSILRSVPPWLLGLTALFLGFSLVWQYVILIRINLRIPSP